MPRLFIFGLGYTATRVARALPPDWEWIATGSRGSLAFDDEEAVRRALASSDAVLSSVPPGRGDPVLDRYGDTLGGRLVYLSSTGVYGDAGGAWVDEHSPTGGGRRKARAQADAAWLERGAWVLRLPGIYGPGRSAFDRLASGRAHLVDAPGQVFSRAHVADIASAAIRALVGDSVAGAYNIADDLPTSQNVVIEAAARMAGLPVPPMIGLDDPSFSEMARGFYTENRRIANGKAKRVLGWRPAYPTWREGLAACATESGGRTRALSAA